jgi:hypothetical protein
VEREMTLFPDTGHSNSIRRYNAFALILALASACNSVAAPADPDPSGGGGTSGEGGMAGRGGAGGREEPGGKAGAGGGGAGGSGAGGHSAPDAGGGPPPQPDAAQALDAASGDALGVDAAPGGAGTCGGKFCDDFEAYEPGAAPAGDWMVRLAKGMLAVDGTRAFSGGRSVRLTHAGAPAVMFMQLRTPLLPLPGGVVHGRLMYYLTKSPTGQYTHFEIVRGGGPLSGTARAQLNTGAENGKLFLNYEPGDCSKPFAAPFPEKKWACYQFRFDLVKNEMWIAVDGQAASAPLMPTGGCWRAPTVVDTLHIGWESYHGAQPVELWIDDVAVGDQPIPCPTGPPSKP